MDVVWWHQVPRECREHLAQYYRDITGDVDSCSMVSMNDFILVIDKWFSRNYDASRPRDKSLYVWYFFDREKYAEFVLTWM